MGRYLELLEKEAANRAGKRGTEGQTKGGPKGAPKYNNTPSVPLVPRSPVPVGRTDQKEDQTFGGSVNSNKTKLYNNINDVNLNPGCVQPNQGGGDTSLPALSGLRGDERDRSPFLSAFIEFRESLKNQELNHKYVSALADATIFLRDWGHQAEALGWSAGELFGLDPVAPLSRYDIMGLVWMLDGQRVVALTADAAIIKTESGSFLKFYRRGISHTWAKCI